MARNSTKKAIRKTYYIIFFLGLIVLASIVGIGIFIFNSSSPAKNKNVFSVIKEENTVKPVLSANYQRYEINSTTDLLVSKELHYSVQIPNDAWIHEGGSFSREFPERETAQLAIYIPKESANLVVTIGTGKKQYSSSEEMLEAQTSYNLFDTNYTPMIERTLNNTKGVESYGYQDQFGSTSYFYITEYKDRFLQLSYYFPAAGSELTYKEANLAKQIISTFRVVE